VSVRGTRGGGWVRAAAALWLAGALLAGCAPAPVLTTGEFPALARLDTVLQRGRSTRADVERLLGFPAGRGHVLIPIGGLEGRGWAGRDVWYYEDIEATGMDKARREGSVTVIPLRVRQQVLLVLFDGPRFDGYLWFSNAQRGVGHVR